MTREEAENRINDLAWQIRDVILEYNPNETYFTLGFSEGTTGKAFSWLSYWNLCSYREDGSNKPLEVHCPIPSEKMVRYRESLSIDSPLADSCSDRFVDEICGTSEGTIDVWLCQKEDIKP